MGKGFGDSANGIASKHMARLVNDIAKQVRVKMEDAAYDTMQEYYNEYKPRYYKRTHNLRMNSYDKAVINDGRQNHRTAGVYSKEISVTFSPNNMEEVYFESHWENGKYELDMDKPVPKDLIFTNSFIYGLHGSSAPLDIGGVELLSSLHNPPRKVMQDKVNDITEWLKTSPEIQKMVEQAAINFGEEYLASIFSKASKK